MSKWYYAKNGNRNGPVEPDEIKKLFQAGEIKPDDLVWEEGMPDWVRAESVLQAAPTELAASAPAPQPLLGQPATAIPDFGDFLCWGVLLFWSPMWCFCARFNIILLTLLIGVFVVLHLIELNAVRTAVAEGRLQPSDYSNNHPVLVGFALFITGCCFLNLFHPFLMHLRNKSGVFKQQPHAVWVSLVVSLVCGAIVGFLLLTGFLSSFLETMQQQAAAGR